MNEFQAAMDEWNNAMDKLIDIDAQLLSAKFSGSADDVAILDSMAQTALSNMMAAREKVYRASGLKPPPLNTLEE